MIQKCIGKLCGAVTNRALFSVTHLVEKGIRRLSDDEARREFPLSGRVFYPCPQGSRSFPSGSSVYSFDCEENPRVTEPSLDKELFWIADNQSRSLKPCVRIWRGFESSSPETLRQRLLEGIADTGPKEDLHFFIMADSKIGLRINLFFNEDDEKKYLAKDTKLVKSFSLVQNEILSLDGEEYIKSDSNTFIENYGCYQWCGSREFIGQTLNKLRPHILKNTSISSSEIKKIKQNIMQYVVLLEQDDVNTEAWLERFAYELEKTAEEEELCHDLRAIIESSIAWREQKEGLELSLRQELTQSLDDAIRQERSKSLCELADLQQQRVSLNAERDALEQWVHTFYSRLENIPRQSYREFTTLLERLDDLNGPNARAPFSPLPPVLSPWARGQCEIEGQVISLMDFCSRFVPEDQNILSNPLAQLDVFARSGDLPLIMGGRAESFIRRYAAYLTGGHYYFFQPDPTLIALDDFWRSPGTELPTSFALAWQRACTRTERFSLLWLANLDKGPWYLWLEGLSTVLRSEVRPPNLIIIASCSKNFIPDAEQKKWTSSLCEFCIPLILEQESPLPEARCITYYDQKQRSHASTTEAKRLRNFQPYAAESYPEWCLEVRKAASVDQAYSSIQKDVLVF